MEYKYHKTNKLCDWKRRGVVLREGETYDIFYDKWVKATHCECCNVELDFSGSGKKGRCLDHDHETGHFRNILCNSCNHKRVTIPLTLNKTNTSGILNVSKRVRGNHIHYLYKRTRNGNTHRKYFKTIEEAIQYKKEYENKI